MGIDASLLFYRGAPLTPSEWAEAFVPVLAEVLEGQTLGFVHFEAAFVPAEGAPLNVVSLFQGGETTSKRVMARILEKGHVDALKEEARDRDRSLSDVVQMAWKIMRTEMKAEAEERDEDDTPEEEDDAAPRTSWIAALAVRISTLRDEALWAMDCDHALFGKAARAKHGALLFDRDAQGEVYQAAPDAALADFAGWAEASVHACYRCALDEPAEAITYFMVARGGALLEAPEKVSRDALRDFEHVLDGFD